MFKLPEKDIANVVVQCKWFSANKHSLFMSEVLGKGDQKHAEHSFIGQQNSYLSQKGYDPVLLVKTTPLQYIILQ